MNAHWAVCGVLCFSFSCQRDQPQAYYQACERAFHPIGGLEGENPVYDSSIAPARVVEALGLQPGQRIADVGAGRGYFVFRFADAVGARGQVVATDIDDLAIDVLRKRVASRENISIRKAQPDEPGLEAHAYDLIFMSQVDHFLQDRVAFLKKLKGALAPHGRLAVTHVRALRAPLEEAAIAAGFRVVADVTELPSQYLLIFEPASS